MAFQKPVYTLCRGFSCTASGTSIAEQMHSTNFMGVGRGEVYPLRKCAEQFLMHFHITHFYCIFAMCTYEALWSCLAEVSNVFLVGSKYYQVDRVHI